MKVISNSSPLIILYWELGHDRTLERPFRQTYAGA